MEGMAIYKHKQFLIISGSPNLDRGGQ